MFAVVFYSSPLLCCCYVQLSPRTASEGVSANPALFMLCSHVEWGYFSVVVVSS